VGEGRGEERQGRRGRQGSGGRGEKGWEGGGGVGCGGTQAGSVPGAPHCQNTGLLRSQNV